jgi:sec-independent protein translocase protein TatC
MSDHPALPSHEELPELDEKRMPFLDHIGELRSRLRNSVLGVVLALIVCYIFRWRLFYILSQPLLSAFAKAKAMGVAGKLVFISPVEMFMVLLKTALVSAIFVASPIIFQQLWSFISPGLYPHEKRWALPFVFIAVLLFVGGGMFCYTFVLPAGYEFFLTTGRDSMTQLSDKLGPNVQLLIDIQAMISMDEYFGLTLMLLLVFGVVFELPLVLSVLSLLGIVSAAALWRWNRYAILMFAIGGAILTPGDLVIGQLAMTGSLTVLYNLSIVVAWLVERKRSAAEVSGNEDGEKAE